jgi:hypothetical protein
MAMAAAPYVYGESTLSSTVLDARLVLDYYET